MSNQISTSSSENKQTLFKIFTGNEKTDFEKNSENSQSAIASFQGMIRLENQGQLNVLYVESTDPIIAKNLNSLILKELKEVNRLFKIQHVNEKVKFIEQRIVSVKDDLESSEKDLKSFRERNRQISSPSLQLELERLNREVEVQKNVFLTLKQQYELSKIEEVQEGSVFQILDQPQLPLYPINRQLKLSLIVAFIFGSGIGVVLALVRSYFNSSNVSERRKLKQVNLYINKKSREIFFDRRFTGTTLILMIIFAPTYFGQKSSNPEFFGMYSSKMLMINVFYFLGMTFLAYLLLNQSKKK